ncbi:MAG TPA: protein kinase [Opitutaceae bacterium]|nr:protein kinase [Opitutaceae bacterium]
MDDLEQGATIRGFAPGFRVFNRFTLRRILGRGGMGVVWLARDEDLDRDVALKFLPDVVALDPVSVAELKRETRRNLELTHPHIVRIYDFVQDARSAAISMEYVDGSSLSTLRLERPQHVFPLAEVERLFVQLADGLAYAHEKARIVHRDLKPANLMVNSRGELKITDFGIATSIADSVSRMSGLNSSSGTAVYMSPQQMMGEKPSATDDIYALGATLYELLTGKPPFYTGNIILQVTQKTAPSIAARREELGIAGLDPVPAHWERAIAACLAKEPADRPQTTRALQALLAGEAAPASAPPPTARPPAVLGPERPPTGIARPPAATQPAPRSGTAAHSSRAAWIAAAAAAVLAIGAGVFWFWPGRTGAPIQDAQVQRPPPATPKEEPPPVTPQDGPRPQPGGPAGVAAEAQKDAPAAVAARPVAAPPAPASLRLTTVPEDAEVRFGERILRAPIHLTDLPAGPIELLVRREGYRDRRLQFDLAAGQSLDVPAIRLEEILVPVDLTARQTGLTYRLQGPGERSYSGALPDRLEVPRGRYEITVTRAGYGEQRGQITVGAEPAGFMADIPGARIEVTSQPAGALVRVGDRVLGPTPLRLEDQPPGSLSLTVSAEHFDTQDLMAELKRGERWTRHVELAPDAATLALRDMDGYWTISGFVGALGDSVMHISAADRKVTMAGKALWRKAVLEATAGAVDREAGGLLFNGRTADWEGTFALAREGELVVFWLPAYPKQKTRYKRTTAEDFERTLRTSR